MAKRKDIKDSKSEKPVDSTGIKIFKVVLWPFRIIFVGLSWIVKGIILGVEWIIGSFSKAKKNRRKESSKDRSEHYVPFSVVKPISGSYARFESMLSKKDSTIGIILGARGSGKSAVGMKLLENLHALNDRKTYAMGFQSHEMPSWITLIDDISQIENNSYVLIDEGGILFNAREGFSDANKLLSELLLIARHKDLSIMFISQNSSNLEINAIRQADYLVLKPSSLLQKDFERKKIKEIYDEVSEDFDRLKNVKGMTYIYSDAFKGFVANPLPTFWTQKISKSYSGKKG